MIQACGTTLKEGGDNHHTVLLGEVAEELRGGTRNRLCLVEHMDILLLTEIESVVQFLQHNEFRTLLCQLTDLGSQPRLVISDVSRIMLLYQSYIHIVIYFTYYFNNTASCSNADFRVVG